MEREFKIKEGTYNKIKRRIIFNFVLGVSVYLPIIICLDLVAARKGNLYISLTGYAVPGLVILIVFTWAVIKQYKDTCNEFKIVINGDTITKHRRCVSDVKISRECVESIIEDPKAGIMVVSDKFAIGIPNYVDNFQDMRSLLQKWSDFGDAKLNAADLLRSCIRNRKNKRSF